MDAIQQLGLPVLGIIAAAAVTFYVVSFSEIREVLYFSWTLITYLKYSVFINVSSILGKCRNHLENLKMQKNQKVVDSSMLALEREEPEEKLIKQNPNHES